MTRSLVSLTCRDSSQLVVLYRLDTTKCGGLSTELLIVAIVVPIVVVILIVLVLIAIFVKPVRRRVFPYRQRKEAVYST